jgi:acetyl-CoA carboxylase alpha subunit
VLAAANGWLGPLPPEGASAIVHRTVDRAGEMAASQGVRATDLWRDGIVDRVVPERPDAADEPVEFCLRLGRVLAEELAGLLGRDEVERMRSRARRWRHLGR